MIDLIDHNDESRIRYRARRRGFQVLRTPGREYRRRLACGQGDLMLLIAARFMVPLSLVRREYTDQAEKS